MLSFSFLVTQVSTSVRKAGICIGSMTRRTQAVNITEQWLLGESCQSFSLNKLILDSKTYIYSCAEYICRLLGNTAHGDRYLDVSKLMWHSQGDHMHVKRRHARCVWSQEEWALERKGLSSVRVVNLKQPLIFKVLHRGSRLWRQANLIAKVNWILEHQEGRHLAFQL